MPFNFTPTPNSQASGDKRAGEVSAQQQVAKKTKLPPLADLVAMESAPKRPAANRLAAVAPLNICVYKVWPPTPAALPAPTQLDSPQQVLVLEYFYSRGINFY